MAAQNSSPANLYRGHDAALRRESTAATRLPPVLARYHRANPEVQIELVTRTTGALLEQVSRYAIEAAFGAERFESAGLEMMPVFRERLVVIAPKEITAIKKPGIFGV